ncbi:MAG: hypothetical protein DMF60_02760 [Acidobacteria bacterium]|nr:MAG: hypothetical protein DMF60_02760 [Acidobacteriota bacterium]
MNLRADQVAHWLSSLGVGPETLVGVFMERSLELMAGVLGILKAGGTYVPIDPSYPKGRIAYMLADSKAPVLLTQRSMVEHLPENDARVICIDQGSEAFGQGRENLAGRVSSDSLAYMMYTSGSTGTPKGVLGSHRAMVNRFSWMWNAYPFEADDVCCQKTSLSFIDSVWEMFGPLLRGVRTVIIPTEEVKDITKLINTLSLNRITRIVLVPSLLDAMLETHADVDIRLPDLVMWVASGGALSRPKSLPTLPIVAPQPITPILTPYR